MAVDFGIEEQTLEDGSRVVAVRGEIDLFTAPEFKGALSRAIDAGPPRIVVDLTATTFVDSSSLGVLIGAHKRLARRDGALAIACDNRAILNTLEITGLLALFEIAATREAALHGGSVGAG